jgi:sulfur carrier protein ThiS adenylyltransferase
MVTREALEQAMDKRFSPEVYEKFKQARVCIAGLGGLGSNIAIMLARSGIGTLKLIDFDRVDTTNLNRQAYRIEHIDMPKTEALGKMIAEINPYINIEVIQTKVTEENLVELFQGEALVCEAFDNPEYKAMLVNYLLEQQPETTVVSGSGMAGIGSSNNFSTTQKMKRLYVCGDEESDAYAGMGLLSPRVSICAGHQANMLLRLILGETES